jgi:hypothetical protein
MRGIKQKPAAKQSGKELGSSKLKKSHTTFLVNAEIEALKFKVFPGGLTSGLDNGLNRTKIPMSKFSVEPEVYLDSQIRLSIAREVQNLCDRRCARTPSA